MYSSPDGRWLLLLEQDPITKESIERRVSLWNPITKQSIELPRWSNPDSIRAAVMSGSPDDVSGSWVIYFFLKDSVRRHMAVCRLGDAKWRVFNYEQSIIAQTATCDGIMNHPNSHACYFLHRPVSLKGKVYALISCSDELVEISLDALNQTPRITVLQRNSVTPVYGSYVLYLVPWQGRHLYLIKLGFLNSLGCNFREVPVIEVFSFNFSTRGWNSVKSLLGGAVFLGDAYSSASATSQGKWSFIVYYTCRHIQSRDCCFDQMVFSYRLEDGKVTSYAPCPDYMHRQSSTWRACWIMPATDTEHSVDGASSITEKGKVMEIGSCRPICNDALKPCLKKRKSVDAQGGYTMMRCSRKENVLLCDLLPELKESIAERFPSFVDYTYFLNINRLIGSDVPRRRKNAFRPCLIYREKMEDSYCIVDSNINRKVLVKIPKRVSGKSIGCCRYGWLLVEDGSSCSLFNPLTQQVIETVGIP